MNNCIMLSITIILIEAYIVLQVFFHSKWQYMYYFKISDTSSSGLDITAAYGDLPYTWQHVACNSNEHNIYYHISFNHIH